MPDPKNDRDQHRFAQIKGRMLDGVAQNIKSNYMGPSGAKTREDYRSKLTESGAIMDIIECCAYTALRMEEERGGRRPG